MGNICCGFIIHNLLSLNCNEYLLCMLNMADRVILQQIIPIYGSIIHVIYICETLGSKFQTGFLVSKGKTVIGVHNTPTPLLLV